jgi:aminoglycoside 2'-N-acetyltransferase I
MSSERDAESVTDLDWCRTGDMSAQQLHALRSLLDAAFDGRFTDEDWSHTVGGVHVLVRRGDLIVAHAAVVPRTLVAGQRSFSTGYVEGVATRADSRHRGHATEVMRAAGDVITRSYDLGALSTGVPELYTPLGWESWQGPTYVNSPTGRRRTKDEDDGVMVLRTGHTRTLDLTAELTCDWRTGDVW